MQGQELSVPGARERCANLTKQRQVTPDPVYGENYVRDVTRLSDMVEQSSTVP